MKQHTIACEFPEGCSCGASKWNKKNIEFAIAWCETNLRWLAGDPPSEERTRKEQINVCEIERLKSELAAEQVVGIPNQEGT